MSGRSSKYLTSVKGIEVEKRNMYDYTALLKACKCRQWHIVHYLISEQHCDVNVSDTVEKNTPLHLACEGGHLETVKLILSVTDNMLEKRNGGGLTPFLVATCYGNFNIAQYLLCQCCCDASVCDSEGNNALHDACRYNHLEQWCRKQIKSVEAIRRERVMCI